MKLCLVCSHGGHFMEMLQLLDAFEEHIFFYATYSSEATKKLRNSYLIPYKNSRVSLIIMCLLTVPRAFFILIKEKPDIIVTTGGGEIAIPFCFAARILNIKIIYIETLARIDTVSFGGKILYNIADLFLVQWESLLKHYGKKAKYWGKVI